VVPEGHTVTSEEPRKFAMALEKTAPKDRLLIVGQLVGLHGAFRIT
jgi:hypothetical protein